MFTLIIIVCHAAAGNCAVHTPHMPPHFHPPYKSIAACTNQGYKTKESMVKFNVERGNPVVVKFRCVNWGVDV